MKKCKIEGCGQNVWGGGFCKTHQHMRTDKNTKGLKKTLLNKKSVKRSKHENEYLKKKKELLSNKDLHPVCWFSCKKILWNEEKNMYICDIHHKLGRIEDKLTDWDNNCVFVIRKYHTSYHSMSVDKLINEEWYILFIERLQLEDKDMYIHEMKRHLKAGIITIEKYLSL